MAAARPRKAAKRFVLRSLWGDSQVTTIKVGTFKMKVHTNVTLVFKQDDGKSTSMSTAADEVREDGGWEFTGPGGALPPQFERDMADPVDP